MTSKKSFIALVYVQLNHETKMVTYFNRKDLVKFGNYLLSDERKEALQLHPDSPLPTEERLKSVSDADIMNWLDEQEKEY